MPRSSTSALATLALALAGCPASSGESAGGTGETTISVGGPVTTRGSATMIPANPPATGGGTTTGGVTTTGLTTTGEPTTGAATTIDSIPADRIPPELLAACSASCTQIFECVPEPPQFQDIDACNIACRWAAYSGPACVRASVAFARCLTGLECALLRAGLATGDYGRCNEALAQSRRVCQKTRPGGPGAP